jgi:hypothetical protein
MTARSRPLPIRHFGPRKIHAEQLPQDLPERSIRREGPLVQCIVKRNSHVGPAPSARGFRGAARA